MGNNIMSFHMIKFELQSVCFIVDVHLFLIDFLINGNPNNYGPFQNTCWLCTWF